MPLKRAAMLLSAAVGPALGQATSLPSVRVWTARVDTVGSAPRILSPGYTQWRDSTTGWRMALVRTSDIRGADSGSYNGAWRTLLLPDGRVLVTRQTVPMAPAQPPIQLYDDDGQFVREIGRIGSGPEEFRSTPTLTMKGDTLIAFDGIQSRVMLFTLGGQFIRAFQVAVRGSPIPIAIDHRGLLRIQQRYGLFNDTLSHVQWVYYTLRGAVVDSLARPPLPEPRAWRALDGTRAMAFQVPFTAGHGDTFLPDGTLVYGTADSMKFVVTRTGRDTVRIFGRSDITSVPVPAAVKDSLVNSIVAVQPLLGAVANPSDLPDSYPVWSSMAADDKGFLWVATGYRGRTPVSFSIFGPDGRYLGNMASWFDRFDAASWSGDQIAYVGFDKDRRAVLRTYRVDRRGN